MPRYYKFMLGEKSKYAEECYIGGFISTWYEIDIDLTAYISNEKALKDKCFPLLSKNYCKLSENEKNEKEKILGRKINKDDIEKIKKNKATKVFLKFGSSL